MAMHELTLMGPDGIKQVSFPTQKEAVIFKGEKEREGYLVQYHNRIDAAIVERQQLDFISY